MFLVDHWMPHAQNWKYNRNPPAHPRHNHCSPVPAHQHLCVKPSMNGYDWVTEEFKKQPYDLKGKTYIRCTETFQVY